MLRVSLSARTSFRISGFLLACVFTGVGRGATESACTVHVHAAAGHPIQDATDDAPIGSTICVDPGVYDENLYIAKDGITLKGAGPEQTILEPPPPGKQLQVCVPVEIEPISYQNFGLNGIGVADVNADGESVRVVSDIRVTGFTVRNFPGVGIIFVNANRIRADHNVAANNQSYGITAFNSTHGEFEYNTSYGSGDSGFYVGDSPNADFKVRYNTAFDDLWGILVRDASNGVVTDNLLRDSCSGLVFLNSGTSTGVHDWQASHNIVVHNNKFCSAEAAELPFALTGIGILIAGGDHLVLRSNRVLSNQPGGPPSLIHGAPLAGGVVVVSTADVSIFPGFYGGVATHNTILHNTVNGNKPFDLVYDGLGSYNEFKFNACETSEPSRLCDGKRDLEDKP